MDGCAEDVPSRSAAIRIRRRRRREPASDAETTGLVRAPVPYGNDDTRHEETMNTAIRYVIPIVILLTAATVALHAAAAPQVLEKTRDAVVKGVTIAADK